MARQARRHAPALVLALATVGAVLAGCAGAGAESESPFPARPAEIDVDELDPCAVLSDQQRRDLDLAPGSPPGIPIVPAGSRGCGWSDFADGYNFTVQTLPTSATESVGADDSRLTEVAGFGAVEATNLGESTPICQLVVDVADSRSLRVQAQSVLYGDDGRPREFGVVCPRAAEFADAVLSSLATDG